MKNTPTKAAVTPVASFLVAILSSIVPFTTIAAEPGSDSESQTEKLAKETQNPIANLISVPFQNNFNFGIGPNDATQWILNVQPVIPIIRPGRHQPQCVPLTGEFRQTDLGRWTDSSCSPSR